MHKELSHGAMGESRENNYRQGTEDRTSIRKFSLCLCVSVVMFSLGMPVWAQQGRIYRDGNSWVEEVAGTMPSARELRVTTDLGSVEVQGNAPRVSYVIRKRSYAPTEEARAGNSSKCMFPPIRLARAT